MKKIVGVIAIVAGLLMLSGCGGTMSDSPDTITKGEGFSVVSVDVGNRTIPCVFYSRGGVTCDWSRP